MVANGRFTSLLSCDVLTFWTVIYQSIKVALGLASAGFLRLHDSEPPAEINDDDILEFPVRHAYMSRFKYIHIYMYI